MNFNGWLAVLINCGLLVTSAVGQIFPDNENIYSNEVTDGVFLDVMDEVLKNLNAKDLSRVAMVCKKWNIEAKREFLKRTMQVLPVKLVEMGVFGRAYKIVDIDLKEECRRTLYEFFGNFLRMEGSNNKISYSQFDLLQVRPFHTLIFADTNFFSGLSKNEAYKSFKLEESSFSFIQALEVIFGTKKIDGLNKEALEIFIPFTNTINVRNHKVIDELITENERILLAESPGYLISKTSYFDEILSSLIELSQDSQHNTIIFFTNFPKHKLLIADYFQEFIEAVSEKLTQRCKPGKLTLWGGNVNFENENSGQKNSQDSLLALSLTGPKLRSWSISVPNGLSNLDEEAMLIEFRDSIELKSKVFGFVLIPGGHNELHEERLLKTEIFRKLFPSIELISLYIPYLAPTYSINIDRPSMIYAKN